MKTHTHTFQQVLINKLGSKLAWTYCSKIGVMLAVTMYHRSYGQKLTKKTTTFKLF